MRARKLSFRTIAICAAAFAAAASVAPVLANDTMDVLLGGQQLQVTTSTGATVMITFAANGTYTTSTGSSGTWTLTGDQLCTVRAADNVSSCGALPSGKALGDSWVTTDGNGATVTASII
jgi:Tol biopolymer transport system component